MLPSDDEAREGDNYAKKTKIWEGDARSNGGCTKTPGGDVLLEDEIRKGT